MKNSKSTNRRCILLGASVWSVHQDSLFFRRTASFWESWATTSTLKSLSACLNKSGQPLASLKSCHIKCPSDGYSNARAVRAQSPPDIAVHSVYIELHKQCHSTYMVPIPEVCGSGQYHGESPLHQRKRTDRGNKTCGGRGCKTSQYSLKMQRYISHSHLFWCHFLCCNCT